MNNIIKKLIWIIPLIVLIVAFTVNAFSTTVTGRCVQRVNEYKQFCFYQKNYVIRSFFNIGINSSIHAVKIWFLPGQKSKMLKKIKEDVNTELASIAKENDDIIEKFEISDDFKKVYIFCYKGSQSSSNNFYSLQTTLTEKVEYRIELYFKILNGNKNTDYDGDIINYVDEFSD